MLKYSNFSHCKCRTCKQTTVLKWGWWGGSHGHLVSPIFWRLELISAATSPRMEPSFNHVTLGAGKDSISTLNSRTSSSLAVSTGPITGFRCTNSWSAHKGRLRLQINHCHWNEAYVQICHTHWKSCVFYSVCLCECICDLCTIDCNSEMFGLALVAHNVSDGADVDAAVFRWGIRHCQSIMDLKISLILLYGLYSSIRLRENDRGRI